MAKRKNNSRTARWQNACDRARVAAEDLESAFGDLKDIQSEYEEWRDNLPENLQSSALAEKLNEVCDLDLDLDDVGGKVDEAENVDLPRGFGRD